MESSIVIVLVVLIVKVLCNPLTNDPPVEVTYAELQALGINCYPSDTCQKNETVFGLYPPGCDCDSSCSLYDTCCVDSEFRNHKSSPKRKSNLKCLQVYSSLPFEIFMVGSCKTDETFVDLCFGNPEESNDPFLMIPVTSNLTGVTYKNYFCAICNEEVDSEQLRFWDIKISSNDTLVTNISEPQFHFNKMMKSWTVNDGKNNETSAFPVNLEIKQNLEATVKYCSTDLIENCSSNWTDEAVASKCKDYMAIVISFQNARYRNPHCALCNFENLTDIRCNQFGSTTYSISAPASSVGLNIPLINLFILEDRPKRCGKNMVYDKFADKCRCNSRIYTKENGKCVHKI
ncbi:unnamed protein product [Larinioides sclopetarius]|uniref:SMB domain-containing protein n=1 Tax=Larinioides sclopetarius TaxID=280406 RepID=A0AAV2AGY0_9ARAC